MPAGSTGSGSARAICSRAASKSFLIENEAYFAEVLRYVALNPVRAKMVARPEDYRWSSYRATAGLTRASEWLDLPSVYLPFGLDETTAQTEYRSFVQARVGSEEWLWDEVTNAIYLGTEAWSKKIGGLRLSSSRRFPWRTNSADGV